MGKIILMLILEKMLETKKLKIFLNQLMQNKKQKRKKEMQKKY